MSENEEPQDNHTVLAFKWNSSQYLEAQDRKAHAQGLWGADRIPVDFQEYIDDTIGQIQGLAELRQCSVCGALPFEIHILTDNKRKYYFTLWKVEEKGKVLIKTDYEKLGEYIEACKRLKHEMEAETE